MVFSAILVRLHKIYHLAILRIADAVFGKALMGLFASDDVFEIMALPPFFIKWLPSQIFHATDIFVGGHCFEPLHNPM